jgi:hypothetical protein
MIADVATKDLGARRDRMPVGLPAEEESQVHPASDRQPGARRADDAGTADEEYVHGSWTVLETRWREVG